MKARTQRTLFGWLLTISIGLGGVALYYYYLDGTVATEYFGQAFWGFVAFSLATLLVSLMPTREKETPSPAAVAPASPETQTAPEPAPVRPLPVPALPPAPDHPLPAGANRIVSFRLADSEVPSPSGPVSLGLIEHCLGNLALSKGTLGTNGDFMPVSRLQEGRSRLRATGAARPDALSALHREKMLDDWLVQAMSAADPRAQELARHWQLKYEAEREALRTLWLLFLDAEAEIAALQPEPPAPAAEPAPEPIAVPAATPE